MGHIGRKRCPLRNAGLLLLRARDDVGSEQPLTLARYSRMLGPGNLYAGRVILSLAGQPLSLAGQPLSLAGRLRNFPAHFDVQIARERSLA